MSDDLRGVPSRHLLPLGSSDDRGADSRLGLTTSRLNRSVVVVSAAGEVDISTADRLRDTLVDALAGTADGCVAVLDLGQVTFFDSSGLQALVAAYRHAQARGTSWRLCGARPVVAQVIELTNLDRLFAIHPDLASALTGG